MSDIKILENLIKETNKISYENKDDLDVIKAKAEMIVKKLFGDKSQYLSTLERISYFPNYASGRPISDYESAFDRGLRKFRDTLNVMLEDRRIDAGYYDNQIVVENIEIKTDKKLKSNGDFNWNKVIFLAHASEDKPFVRKLYKTLKNSGLQPWLDEENLMPGVKWDNKIKEAIKNARFFLACLSAHSISKSGYIQKELRMALNELERKATDVIYFIPALIEDVDLPAITVGTISLRDYQAARIYDDDGLQKLINHLKEQANIIEEVKRKENPTFQKLRAVISEGRIEESLKMLQDYVKGRDDYMMNDVILITSRYNQFKMRNISGVISSQEYSMGSNKIVYSLLEMIKVLEEKEKNKN